MTQEDKQLLLQYLSAALFYKVKIQVKEWTTLDTELKIGHIQRLQNDDIEIKPYLRSMSSMTEEEEKEFESIWDNGFGKALDAQISNFDGCVVRNLEIIASFNAINWLLKKHFDFMGLIPMGLAIEVTEENNPYENNNSKTV